ncbi:phage tail tape measure protein [Sphingobacterium faecium]|uniref:phage tail tape measure protein n=1 Tax=Sphingobacterium faecium TaxID=34087 RepID=UPI0024691761|nr:phage tail tape measure protein [Sphingobacterium faecium]MDH5825773.1 phage tail tape measure protein [Sphingobacterium faecium]
MSFTAIISAQVTDFISAIDRAQARIDSFSQDVGQRVATIGSTFQKLGTGLSLGVTTPLTAMGVAAFNMAADFQDAFGATDQIFKESSDNVKNWANSLNTAFGISKKEAMEYSNMMGSMLVNIGGLTEDQASKQSAKLIELAGDLTAMYGGTTQDAVRALTGALKGNNTMLDNYGMAANDALVKAKALSLGLVEQGKEMTLAAKQTATLALIYEQSGAAQGQAAREAEGASGSMRAFKTEISNLTTEFGEHLLPIITPFINKLREAAVAFRSLSPEVKKSIVIIAGVTAAIGPMLLALGTVMTMAPMIGTAFAVMTGPIGLAVAAIAAATILIIKYWDDIKAYFTSGNGSKLWDDISSGAKELYDELKLAMTQISDFISSIWSKIGGNIKTIAGAAFDNLIQVVSIAVNAIIGIVKFFSNVFKGDFKGAFEAVKTMAVSIFNSLQNIVGNMLKGLGNIIASFFKLLGADSWGTAIETFSNKLSPSINKVKDSATLATEAIKSNTSAVSTNTTTVTANAEELKKAADAAKKVAEEQRALNKELSVFILSGRNQTDHVTVLENIQLKYTGIREVMSKIANIDPFKVALVSGLMLEERLKALTDSFKSLVGVDVKVKGAEAIQLPEIKTDALDKTMADVKAKVSTDVGELNLNLSEMISSGITDSMSALGEAIASGENAIGAIGKALLGTLGGIIKDIGKQLIALGSGMLAAKLAIKNPFLALAAGAAMVALGSAFSAGASKSLGAIGGSGGYTNSSNAVQNNVVTDRNTGRAYNNDKQEVTLRLRGGDLVGAFDYSNNRNNRLS